MSIQLQVGMRSHAPDPVGSAYFPQDVGQRSRRSDQPRPSVVPFSFPASKDILWNRQPTGDSTVLHITKYRNVSLQIVEKSVQLAFRHALQSDQKPYVCFLIGSVTSDKDEEGVTLTVDRFDPGRDIPGRVARMPTAKLPGDHVIPFIVSIKKEMSTTHSQEDFQAAFKLVQHHFSSCNSLDIASTLSLRIHCCCYDNVDDVTFSLHIGAVTMGNTVEATPINAVPIIPTALARNLTGPLSLSDMQGTPKVGFITMDQTRKLLLLLDSDPKAYTLPLVGIWLSGLTNICSPFVWASCLRYLFSRSINERVCGGQQGFLLVIFSPSSRQPRFYECRSLSRDQTTFELVGCRENLHTYKHGGQSGHSTVQLELTPARDGPNRTVFMEAIKYFQPSSSATKTKKPACKSSTHSTVSAEEDGQIVPRPSPKPLTDKSPSIKPSVPELSLIFDSFTEEPNAKESYPSTIDPTAKENQSLGTSSRFKSLGRTSKTIHTETPPGRTGRPGPLKPVNTNLAHTPPNVQQHSPAVMQGAPLIPSQIMQSHPDPNPKKSHSSARMNHHRREILDSSRPSNDCISRQKPPKPTSRRSEIATPHTKSPVSQKAPSMIDGSARRKSCPLPVASKNHQERIESGEKQTRLHPNHNPVSPQGEIYQHHHLSQTLPPSVSHSQGLAFQVAQESSRLGNPPSTGNPSHFAASSCTVSGVPSSNLTPSTFSNFSLDTTQTSQNAALISQPSVSPAAMHDSIPATPLTVTSSPHHITLHENPLHQAQYADSTLVTSYGSPGTQPGLIVADPVSGSTSPGQGPSPNPKPSPNSIGIESNDFMVQLRRQEQLIQQLQGQIQMLLQAQASQSTPPIPSGLMTPPATPTTPTNRYQQLTPPNNAPHGHHSHPIPPPVRHSIATDTGYNPPPGKTTCSMAVMTGDSLLWPEGEGRSPKTKATSVATSMTPQKSPAVHSSPDASKDPEVTCGSAAEISLPSQETMDQSQSTVFDMSAVDLPSFAETSSPRKTSSPTRSPDWKTDRDVHPLRMTSDVVEGLPLDNLRSPVLGESASTCAPSNVRSPSAQEEEEEEEDDDSDVNPEDGMEEGEEVVAQDPPVSLLYRDEKQFYQRLLEKVERMLGDQSQAMDNPGYHGNAMAIMEGAGLTTDGTERALDHSLMYRSVCMVSADFFPRINYVSLMDVELDSPSVSYEANAIALKYLSEEELVQLSASFKGQAGSRPRVNPLLRSALRGLHEEEGAMGSSVELSMASRRYMEKYGLLDSPTKKPSMEDAPAERFPARNSEGTLRKDPSSKRVILKTSKPKAKSSCKVSQPLPTVKPLPSKQSIKEPPNPDRPSPESRSVRPEQSDRTVTDPSPTQGPKPPLGMDLKRVGEVKGRERQEVTKKPISNILDINRLKQLPKLF